MSGGAAAEEASVVGQPGAQGLRFGDGLVEDGQQFVDGVEMTDNHNDQCLQEVPVRVEAGGAAAACGQGREPPHSG